VSAAYRAANPDKVKAGKSAYYAANPNKIAAYYAANRVANPKKFREACAKWKSANPEKVKIAMAKWRDENPERVKAYSAAYRAANKDKIRDWRAAYHAENPEKGIARTAKWRANNPEAKRIQEHTRRARKREIGGKLSKGLSERLFKLQRGKCACCGKPLGDNFHLDHIMPLALGGANEDWNIQLLTRRCNAQKHAKHPIEFMQLRGFLI
jgi:5-methylcytosine-specific restriction endonuclease McrA